MKKPIVLLVMFLAVLSFSYALNPLSLRGDAEILSSRENTSLESVKETILKTEENKAEVSFDSLSITLDTDTLLCVLEKKNETTVYLVYGKAGIKTEENIPLLLYTPVTLIKTDTSVDVLLVSTDTEEKAYNYSSSPLRAYDGIRGIYVDIESTWDYFKNRSSAAVPEKPVFVDVETTLSLPDEPVVPSIVTTVENDGMTVTRTLVDND